MRSLLPAAARWAHRAHPYASEHNITGEILVHLDHEALKDVGIHSVGQRLAILRAVYALKVQQNVPVEGGHYVPPCELHCTLPGSNENAN